MSGRPLTAVNTDRSPGPTRPLLASTDVAATVTAAAVATASPMTDRPRRVGAR